MAKDGEFVVMRFPENYGSSSRVEPSRAGIGFVENGVCRGWLSSDGENWVPIDGSFGLAVEPRFVSMGAQAQEKGLLGKGVDLDEIDGEIVRFRTEMLPAAPNPFNPETQIRFSLKESSFVQIDIFDIMGRRVVKLVCGEFNAGLHSVAWKGRDKAGRRVSSGMYFARLNVGDIEFRQRVTLVK